MKKNRFKCDYDLNGECQLYTLSCKENDKCTLKHNCIMCTYRARGKQYDPCNICEMKDEGKEKI